MSSERLGALAGAGFVLLTVAANFAAGFLPAFDDSSEEITLFFNAHRHAITVGVVLTGAAGPLLAGAVVALSLRLEERVWATLALVCGATIVIFMTARGAVHGAIARSAPFFSAHGLYALSGFLMTMTLWFAAALALATVRAGRTLPRVYAHGSLGVAAVCAVGGLSVRSAGFFSPSGYMAQVALFAFLAWVLATSAVLWRRPSV